jgi:hypothetical protein
LIERPSRDTEAAISLLLIDFGVKAHFLSKARALIRASAAGWWHGGGIDSL